MAERVIFHVDVNSAFLSWTAAYRYSVLGEDFDLREVPSVIAGQKNSRRSIVLAKSTPARKFGIRTGEPLGMARDKCPNLVVAEPDYGLYLSASRRLMELLRSVSPVVEQFSIDEAWMDMTGTRRLYGSPVLAAQWLKDRIWTELGFTVNIGVSSNKMLAKMAGELEKPDKVLTLFPWEIEQKLWPLPVGELFSVGRSTEAALRRMGIRTVEQLAHTDPKILRKKFHKHGETIWHLANGRNADALQPETPVNQGYSNAMTTPWDVTDMVYAQQVLLCLCETASARMRRDGQTGRCVTVQLRTNRFENTSGRRLLPTATGSTVEIYQAACQALEQLWDQETPLRQLGVQISQVSQDDCRQYSLFDQAQTEKLEKLDTAVDSIRDKFGEDAIRRASVLSFENPRKGAQSVAFHVQL